MTVQNIKTTAIMDSNGRTELKIVDDPRLAVLKMSITFTGIDDLIHSTDFNLSREDIGALINALGDNNGDKYR